MGLKCWSFGFRALIKNPKPRSLKLKPSTSGCTLTLSAGRLGNKKGLHSWVPPETPKALNIVEYILNPIRIPSMI